MSLPNLHTGQRRVYNEMKRFNVLLAGRRWRKTTFGAAYLSRYAWINRGEYLWGSPTHDQNKIALSYMERIFTGKDVDFNRSSMTVTLPNGSLIRLRSLNKPDNCRGFTIHGAVIDEAAYTSKNAYKEVIRPTLMDTLGWSMLITTPAGFDWVYDLYNSVDVNLSSWRIPSLGASLAGQELRRTPHRYENPHLSFEELQSLYSTMGDISFRQEVLCEFIADGINPFSNIDLLCSLPSHDRYTGKTVAGLDFAKVKDYTVLSILDPLSLKEIAVHRLPHSQYVDQVDTIRDLCLRYGVEYVCFDNTGVGNAVAEILYPKISPHNIGLDPFTFTNESKVGLINDLILAMEQKRIRFTDDDNGIYEFRRYTREQSGNTVKYGAITGTHDDIVTARALSLRMAKKLGLF